MHSPGRACGESIGVGVLSEASRLSFRPLSSPAPLLPPQEATGAMPAAGVQPLSRHPSSDTGPGLSQGRF